MNLRSTIEAWSPTEERGEAGKLLSMQILDQFDDPFGRNVEQPHFTASAVVASDAGVLLHFHKLAKCWVGPGGHIDAGEQPWDAVLRETLEETGIAAEHPAGGPTLLHIDSHKTPICACHADIRFLLVAPPEAPSPPPDESQEVAWFPVAEALEKVDEPYLPALRAGLGLGFPRLG